MPSGDEDYLDTYFVKWFTNVCCPVQQDRVCNNKKKKNYLHFFIYFDD